MILLALPYSDDEGMIVVVSVALWILTWFLWYRRLRAGSRLRDVPAPRRTLAVAPVAALALVFAVLSGWSSFDVRSSPQYLFQYLALGAAWIGSAMVLFAWLGISARDDGAERGNLAAALALAGALLGIALCYSGGNIGDGPGWWVVVFSSGLATAGFFGSWALLEAAAHPSDWITIDRDVAAGTRHGLHCVAQGLILGRAVAGDWVSGETTLRDFATGAWPALVLLALAILGERVLGPTREEPRRSLFVCGVLPGLLQLAVALTWVALRGGWS